MLKSLHMHISFRLIVVPICFLMVISSCGFEPVYKTNPSSNSEASLKVLLGQINIPIISGRIGHKLRNYLIHDLGSNSGIKNHQYNLLIKIETDKSPLLIQDDDKVSRYNLNLIATFVLIDTHKKSTIYEAHARSVGSFNVVSSEFATLMAEKDAENRAARELSAEINSLLIAFFSR